MLPYERFKDEAEFREKFVKPLLNRLGYYGVSEQHKVRSRAVGRKLKNVQELPVGEAAALLPPNVPEDDVEVGEGDNAGVDSE